MNMLRGAPREVYRVYGEAEFFADGARVHRFEPAGQRTGERWLRLVIGTTLLLAAAGAVGGVIASAGVHPAARAERASRSALLAAAGSLVARARLHVTRGRTPRPAQAGGESHGQRPRRVRRARTSAPRASIPVAASTQASYASAPAAPAAPPAAPTTPRPPSPSEFGFER